LSQGKDGNNRNVDLSRLRSKSLNSQDKTEKSVRKQTQTNNIPGKSISPPKIRQILDISKTTHTAQTVYESILKQQEAYEAILDEHPDPKDQQMATSHCKTMKPQKENPSILIHTSGGDAVCLDHQMSSINEDNDCQEDGSQSIRSRSKSLNNQDKPTPRPEETHLLEQSSDDADRRPTDNLLLTRRHSDNPDMPHSLCSLTPPAIVITKDMEGKKKLTAIKAYENLFAKFFELTKCYDLCPTSGKMVILDDRLLLTSAFSILIQNSIRAAPLWNSSQQKFEGMLTISDFIKMLIRNCDNPKFEEELEKQRCEDWVRILKTEGKMERDRKLIFLSPEDSTYVAIEKLLVNKIHRLPVIDPVTGIVFKIITHNVILKHLHKSLKELPHIPFLQESILDLGIGTHGEIVTAKEDTTIIEALHIFENNRVSGIPIVDPSGQLVDIYCKFDVINIAAKKQYNNLEATLKEATRYRTEWFRGVYKCTPDDSLLTVMNRFARTEVHRLVVVRADETVCGIVSLSDILSYLIHRHKTEQKDDKKQKLTKLCDTFKKTLEDSGFSIEDAINELQNTTEI